MPLTLTFILAVPLIIAGVFFSMGKGLSLVSFNSRTTNTAARPVIGKISGHMLIGLGLSHIALGLASRFSVAWLTWVAVGGMSASVLTGCSRIYRVNRQFSKSKRAGISMIVSLVIVAASLIAVGALLIFGGKTPDVTVGHDSFRVSGMYGRTVSFDDVSGVTLHERSMREIGVGRRTNGYGGAETLKGHFSSAELGAHLLFVRAGASPTIHVEVINGADIFISYDDAERTRELYDELRGAFAG